MDCLLCPNEIHPSVGCGVWLLGMPVCKRCTRDYLCGAGGTWLEKIPADIWGWAILVSHMIHTHKLERHPLQTSRRLAHAKLVGLEADPIDFICWPTLEVDVHGFAQPLGM